MVAEKDEKLVSIEKTMKNVEKDGEGDMEFELLNSSLFLSPYRVFLCLCFLLWLGWR